MHLNPVREKADTISLIKDNGFWETVSVEALENIRKELRGIMKYTDKFTYEPDPPKHIDIVDPDIEYRQIPSSLKFSDMPGFRKKVQEVLLKLFDENETLQKIKSGKPVSNTDLSALTSLILTQNPNVDKDVLEEFFRTAVPLDHAIRSIIGMDAEVVNERFVAFITAHPALNSSQIAFLNLLKNHISRYGSIGIEQLYEPPFTTLHSNGLDGIFADEDMVQELIGIIDAFRPKTMVSKERPYDVH